MNLTIKRKSIFTVAVALICLLFPVLFFSSVRADDNEDDSITDDEFKSMQVAITQGYMSYGTKIKICWESLAGASGYVVYIDQGGKVTNVATVDRMTLSYKLTGLKGGTTYTIGVKGYRRSGKGNIYTASSVIKATTSPARPQMVYLFVSSFISFTSVL